MQLWKREQQCGIQVYISCIVSPTEVQYFHLKYLHCWTCLNVVFIAIDSPERTCSKLICMASKPTFLQVWQCGILVYISCIVSLTGIQSFHLKNQHCHTCVNAGFMALKLIQSHLQHVEVIGSCFWSTFPTSTWFNGVAYYFLQVWIVRLVISCRPC